MLEFLLLFLRCLFAGFQSHTGLVLENLALRHQLAVLKRQAHKPKLRPADRLFWVSLMRIWSHWQQALLLFQPRSVLKCERTQSIQILDVARGNEVILLKGMLVAAAR